MVKALVLFLITLNAYAFNAVVIALEAPLFKSQDKNSRIIQYKRKGAKIILHKADRFGDFYKTQTTTGDESYILKEHVYIYYQDSRELDQIEMDHDNTDYRIPEPLPENYPIRQATGYRGQVFMTFGSFNTEHYSYTDKVIDSSNDSYYSLNFLWSKGVDFDLSKRFFFGVLTKFFRSSSTFKFSNFKTVEQNFKLGIGPYLSYDVWKNKKHMLNLFGSLQVHLYDRLTIEKGSNSVEYSGINLNLKTGLYYSYQKLVANYDFITGISANFNPPATYTSRDNEEPTFFQNSFKTRFNTQVGLFFGFQSNY